MSDSITLQFGGHLDLQELVQFLEEKSERAVKLVDQNNDNLHSFFIEFKDPYDRRKTREIRGHFSYRADADARAYIGDGHYTYMALGEFGNAEKIMRDIGEHFGAAYFNIESKDQADFIEPKDLTPRM